MSGVAVVGREPISDRLTDLYRSGTGRGATLVGPAGIGKTALARRVVERLEPDFDAAWVAGTPAAADIPLAAFAAFLPPAGTEPGITSLVHVRDAVSATRDGRRRLLVVDDAHALDETSAALVQQLTLHGIPVLMTQRSGAAASDTVTRLWRDRTLERIDVEPLDIEAIGALVADVLHGSIDPSSAHDVWRRSAGNPLFARELVIASHAAGEWSATSTGWRWDVGEATTPRLTDLLRERMERLDDIQRDVLVHLAFGEPMGIGEFANVCSDEVLESLERDGLITAEVDRRRLSIRFTHPLHAEVIRRTTSPLRARTVRSRLVDQLRGTGARRRDDVMRLATLAVDAGSEVDRDVLLAAARGALATGDRAVAMRLAQEAFDRDPDFESGHLLADALYEEGRFDDIQRHWTNWVPLAIDDDQRAFVVMHQAISHFYRAGDDDAAFALLDHAREMMPGGPKRDEVTALAATLHTMSGRTELARSLGEPLLSSTDGRVLVQAALATIHAMRAAGATDDALALGRVAMSTLEALGPVESLVSATVFGTGEPSVLLVAGDFDKALRSADAAFEVARRAGEVSAEGLSQLSRSEALLMAGRFRDAALAAHHAEASFARTNHRGFRRWAVSQRAYVAAVAGDASALSGALADLAAIGPHPAGLFAHVETMARTIDEYPADPTSTAAAALDDARRFAGDGNVHAAIRCAYELVLLGDPSAVEQLETWAAGSDAALHRELATHARAFTDDDAEALAAVAERLAAMGAVVFAVRAAEQAASAAERAGDQRRATRWKLMSSAWRDRHQPLDLHLAMSSGAHAGSSPSGPAPSNDVPGPAAPLTRREREIALLAAQGLASRAIGDRLFLSPRTVENHLAKAYGKLGVSRRAELAHVLAIA